MLEILICDDESLHNNFMQKTVARVLQQHMLDGQIVLAANDAESILEYAKTSKSVKLFLLDVHMQDSDEGLKIAAAIREYDKESYIVFITAYPEHSLAGYRTKTFDYLLKPISAKMIEDLLLRVFSDIGTEKQVALTDTLLFKSGSFVHRVLCSDILYFEKSGNVLHMHTINGKLSTYETLKNIAASLPKYFIQCHRAFLVNSHMVKRYDNQNNILLMNNDYALPLSRRYKKYVMEEMSKI